MWDEIDVVPTRANDRAGSPHAMRDLGVLVFVALVAAILPLIG